ncbi:MAG: sigma-54 dependent transcriptional regulator [Myxococcota bacterium]
MPGRILIVDDDAGFARALGRVLKGGGHDVATCGSAAEAREACAGARLDVIVLDYQLPDADGLDLLDELRRTVGSAVFVMATAYPNLDVAVDAMRRGAFDYVAKDADLRECRLRIERGTEVAVLRRQVAEIGSQEDDRGLVGASEPMQLLRSRLSALADADDTTVLITGETGTGKGVVARAIHARSGRAYEPFVAVDCTTIASTLVESELFGHEKGAFSGATASKMGRVEAAGAGSLFLDEIGELELPMQAKLLRLLEEREYTRVGSTRARGLKARIITATNRVLETAVAEGWFRADLRFRLEVFVVQVPPLRDRGHDILLLATHFARERARALGRPEPSFSAEVTAAMLGYRFPGNVRELRNMVEQAVILAQSNELSLDDFPVLSRKAASANAPASPAPPASPRSSPPEPPRASPPPALRMRPDVPPSLAAIREKHAQAEQVELLEALDRAKGNVSAAARALGISRYRLLRRLEKYNLR